MLASLFDGPACFPGAPFFPVGRRETDAFFHLRHFTTIFETNFDRKNKYLQPFFVPSQNRITMLGNQ